MRIASAAALLLCAILAPLQVEADFLHLRSGGMIRGEWTNRTANPAEYAMQTALGSVVVPAAEVQRIEVHKPAWEEYQHRLPLTADTVAAQWELATWCRDVGLPEPRKTHLRRVIQLDPDHTQARQLLGYTYRRGAWLSREQLMRGKGYVHSDGRWRVGQEVELNQKRRQREMAEKEWTLQLRRMREGLAGEQAKQRVAEFAQISDPHAVPGLRKLLIEDSWQPAKLMYLKALRRIDSSAATALLFDVSIRDVHRDVRLTALEHLAVLDPPALTREYVKVLRSKNNVEVNRAAIALAYLNDSSTTVPLIDALVTTHTLVLPGRSSPDTMTSSFSPSGGSNFTTGGGSKRLTGQVRNSEVLTALTAITGRSFGYDQEAWRSWIAARAQAELDQ